MMIFRSLDRLKLTFAEVFIKWKPLLSWKIDEIAIKQTILLDKEQNCYEMKPEQNALFEGEGCATMHLVSKITNRCHICFFVYCKNCNVGGLSYARSPFINNPVMWIILNIITVCMYVYSFFTRGLRFCVGFIILCWHNYPQ